MDKGKLPKVEVFDRRSCNRSMLVPEGSVHRQGNYSANDHPQTSNTVSRHSSMFIKSDKPDKDVFAGNSMVTDTRVELGYCLGMIPEKCSLACEAGKGASIAAPMESPAAGSTAVGVDGGGSSRQSEEGLMKLEELNWDHSFVRELPGDPRNDNMPREEIVADVSCVRKAGSHLIDVALLKFVQDYPSLCRPKVEVLQQLQSMPEYKGLAFHFVEDRLAMLKNVIKEPALDGWNLYLGGWGYNTEKGRREAESFHRIRLLDLSDFSKKLK